MVWKQTFTFVYIRCFIYEFWEEYLDMYTSTSTQTCCVKQEHIEIRVQHLCAAVDIQLLLHSQC